MNNIYIINKYKLNRGKKFIGQKFWLIDINLSWKIFRKHFLYLKLNYKL